MNGKLFLLVGETSRGKDTAARYLREKYGLEPVVSWTDRPPRIYETHGNEHYFMDETHKPDKDNIIVAYTKIGNVQYFATFDELLNKDIYIIDPKGAEFLKTTIKENYDIPLQLVQIYITCLDSVAAKRSIIRGDDPEIFIKRSLDEKEQFHKYEIEKMYDYRVDNNNDVEDMYLYLDLIMEHEGIKKKEES